MIICQSCRCLTLFKVERNALVSVALRVLEYHRGVLFLTTNRIKTFDEAFLSRFSIGMSSSFSVVSPRLFRASAIKYPELDHAARRIIWHKFFELAGIVVNGDSNSTESSSSSDIVMVDTHAREYLISDADLDTLAEKPFNGLGFDASFCLSTQSISKRSNYQESRPYCPSIGIVLVSHLFQSYRLRVTEVLPGGKLLPWRMSILW